MSDDDARIDAPANSEASSDRALVTAHVDDGTAVTLHLLLNRDADGGRLYEWRVVGSNPMLRRSADGLHAVLAQRLAAAEADKRAQVEAGFREGHCSGRISKGHFHDRDRPITATDDWLASRARAELERAK